MAWPFCLLYPSLCPLLWLMSSYANLVHIPHTSARESSMCRVGIPYCCKIRMPPANVRDKFYERPPCRARGEALWVNDASAREARQGIHGLFELFFASMTVDQTCTTFSDRLMADQGCTATDSMPANAVHSTQAIPDPPQMGPSSLNPVRDRRRRRQPWTPRRHDARAANADDSGGAQSMSSESRSMTPFTVILSRKTGTTPTTGPQTIALRAGNTISAVHTDNPYFEMTETMAFDESSSVGPVIQLPPEILSSIFLHCLSESPAPIRRHPGFLYLPLSNWWQSRDCHAPEIRRFQSGKSKQIVIDSVAATSDSSPPSRLGEVDSSRVESSHVYTTGSMDVRSS
ncbi:hypothetical protein B0H14DRAFT_2604207 [Mycena olivaceomarginata]|nr:hypothetical protein B0H14DRAFT_2604207 [Mycena olivaceomarginata]